MRTKKSLLFVTAVAVPTVAAGFLALLLPDDAPTVTRVVGADSAAAGLREVALDRRAMSLRADAPMSRRAAGEAPVICGQPGQQVTTIPIRRPRRYLNWCEHRHRARDRPGPTVEH